MSANFTIYASGNQSLSGKLIELIDLLIVQNTWFIDPSVHLGEDVDEPTDMGLKTCLDHLVGGTIDRLKVKSNDGNAKAVLFAEKDKFYLSIWAVNEALEASVETVPNLELILAEIMSLISCFRDYTVRNPLLDQSVSIRHNIPFYFLPNITLNWKTVLAPDYYLQYWEREVLLRAPAVAVHEHPNGWIELQTYRDLFDPLGEESLAQVRRLACYLEKYHKKAWDSIWGSPQLYEGGDKRPGCADCDYE